MRASAEIVSVWVCKGAGRGPTHLNAFDAALLSAGVGNFNIFRLSSIVPASIPVTLLDSPASDIGDGRLLPCVYSVAHSEGTLCSAGIAISRPIDLSSSVGVIFECSGSYGYAEARENLSEMTSFAMANRGIERFETEFFISSIECATDIGCACVVVAMCDNDTNTLFRAAAR